MLKAVFLDRDDTLIANAELPLPYPGDLLDPAFVRLLPGVAHGCRQLKDAGFNLVVVTNQGGVARGNGTIADVEACNSRMADLLRAEAGITFDAIYYCPYHPLGTVKPYNVEHPWRKPAPGMLLQAAKDLELDIPSSWLIGDAPRDLECAVAAGIPPVHALRVGPDAPYPDFAAAVRTILPR